MKRNISYLYIGICLFILFVLQDVFVWKIPILEKLQTNNSYRMWSGLGVFMLIAYQWMLTIIRIKSKNTSRIELFYNIHTWLGAFAPLLFYIHSTHLGYAYLLVLSLAFYSNFFIGLLNMDVIKQKINWFFQTWMITHVSLSLLISGLTIYHIWIVFYYN